MISAKKTLIYAGLACATLVGSVAANANPIVTSWDFATDGGFVDGSATCSNAPNSCSLIYADGVTPATSATEFSVLSWGTGFEGGKQSAVQIINGSSQLAANIDAGNNDFTDLPLLVNVPWAPIVTNGDWATIGGAVRYNNVITTPGGALDTALINTYFAFAPEGAPPAPAGVANIAVALDETLNEDTEAECSGLNPLETLCDDIFTLTGGLPNFTFSLDGNNYSVQFRTIAGVDSFVQTDGDVTTVYTAENNPGFSTILTQARIVSLVPAPGGVALVGLGLIVLGLRNGTKKYS